MTLLVCGIDVGMNGFASVVKWENGELHFIGSIPLSRDKTVSFHKYKKSEASRENDSIVDIETFVLGLEGLVGRSASVHFYIEKQFRNQSTLRDEGTIAAACSMFKMRNPRSRQHVINVVQSREWLKVLAVGSGKTEHVSFVKSVFKDSDWQKLTHDEADAICLAVYGIIDLVVEPVLSVDEEE